MKIASPIKRRFYKKNVLLTLTTSRGVTDLDYIFHEDQMHNTRERPSVKFLQLLLYISET